MNVINPHRFTTTTGLTPLYRINCGGANITTDGFGNPIPAGEPTWEQDNAAVASQYLVVEANSPTAPISVSGPHAKDASVPAYVPLDVFKSHRYQTGSGSGIKRVYYKIPNTGTIANQTYTVNCFFAFDYSVTRNWDLVFEGVTVDTLLESGTATYICSMKSYQVTLTDGVLDLTFVAGSANNPKIHAVEILG